MEPDDARMLIYDLVTSMYARCRQMPEDEFITPDDNYHVPSYEKAKQYYGNEQEQLLSGIKAGLTRWDTKELKEKYSGKFRDGVEIGERLAVYEGRDFTFTESEDTSESKFTFNS